MNTKSETKQPPKWKVGDVVEGVYTVRELVKGAMCRYYILTNDKENKKLFVKLPSEFALTSSGNLAHFTAEGRLRIEMGSHPHIVTCYGIKNIESVPCIFLEYMDGGSLRDWILEGWCIDYRVNFNLAIQFCHGMEFVHSKGIIHSDLKPENVLMTKEGILKINDFNTARRSPKKKLLIENPLLKNDRIVAGTAGYMSPEHFKDPPNIDERSDIFSFGLCLYEMFCGNKPYDINYVKPQEAPDPVILSRDVNFPMKLAKVLFKCIQWDPEKRFSRFEEIRNELSIIYSELFKEESPYTKIDKIKAEIDYLATLTIFENIGNDRNSVSSVVRKNTQKRGNQIKEIEIEYASKEIDDSKYSWSPKNNTLAYLTGLSIPNCELHTFLNLALNLWKCMSCGYWAYASSFEDLGNKGAIAMADLDELFEDRKDWSIKCIFRGVSDDSTLIKWSPDGQYLSIISHSGTKVFIVDIESLEPSIVEGEDEIFTDTIWSPSSDKLAIIGYQKKDGKEHYFSRIASKKNWVTIERPVIYYYNTEGNQDIKKRAIYSGFAWSPAGHQFAVGDNYGFRIYDLDGHLIDEFINHNPCFGTRMLHWSANDIVYIIPYNDTRTILGPFGLCEHFIRRKMGTELKVIHVSENFGPIAISANAKRVVFVGYPPVKKIEKKGNSIHDLMLFNLENDSEYVIAKIRMKDFDLYFQEKLKIEWSPDGSKILLSGNGDLEFVVFDKDIEPSNDHLSRKGIWVINADGSNPKPVAKGTQASWSHDGSMIAFIRESEDRNKKLCVKKI